MSGKKMLPVAIVAFLIAALVIPVAVWVFVPKMEDAKGTLALGFPSRQWRLISWQDKKVGFYNIRNPEAFARWVDCDKCLYDADLRMRILYKYQTGTTDSYGYEAEITQIWNIKRSPLQPECVHKK